VVGAAANPQVLGSSGGLGGFPASVKFLLGGRACERLHFSLVFEASRPSLGPL
jgi:hypothetical protein